jgi:hypothetical protein
VSRTTLLQSTRLSLMVPAVVPTVVQARLRLLSSGFLPEPTLSAARSYSITTHNSSVTCVVHQPVTPLQAGADLYSLINCQQSLLHLASLVWASSPATSTLLTISNGKSLHYTLIELRLMYLKVREPKQLPPQHQKLQDRPSPYRPKSVHLWYSLAGRSGHKPREH